MNDAVNNPDTAPTPRACEHRRCRRRVFSANLIKARGAPVTLILDAEPKAWIDGGRYKILPTGQPVTTVQKLTATTIHKAFGRNTALYIEHREVCEAEQRKRATARKCAGHA